MARYRDRSRDSAACACVVSVYFWSLFIHVVLISLGLLFSGKRYLFQAIASDYTVYTVMQISENISENGDHKLELYIKSVSKCDHGAIIRFL